MLQAMNTGHEGSLTTVHANTARDAFSRLETLVLLGAGRAFSTKHPRTNRLCFDLIVQIRRLADGTRRVMSITEVTGVQEGVISLQDIYEFRHSEINQQGLILGQHVASGIRPQVETKFKEAGIELQKELFQSEELFQNDEGAEA